MIRKIAKRVAIVLISVLGFMVLSVTAILCATITVSNSTAHELHEAQISFGKRLMWQGDIPAQRSVWTWGRSDGAQIYITYAFGSRRIVNHCGYVAGMFDGRFSFEVDESGVIPNCEQIAME